jgi:membrane protein implicated in regulation of membrane protease activity
MFVTPFRDWLGEQERKGRPLTFLLEWLSIFAVALLFWIVLFLEVGTSFWSLAAAAALSSVYASGFVYVRLLQLTTCEKCKSPLALSQQVIGKRTVHQEEKCLEIEHGGEEWYGHFIDLYSRQYRVEIVKYRCRWCHSIWERVTIEPVDDYVLVRTIELKD